MGWDDSGKDYGFNERVFYSNDAESPATIDSNAYDGKCCFK